MALVYPNSAALKVTNTLRTSYASATLHLLKDTVHPTTSTTVEECEAAEADFSGYAPITLTAWSLSYLAASGSGASVRSLEKQFSWVAPDEEDPEVGNTIYGYFIKYASGE